MRLGIDLGGTKIEAAIIDSNGDIIWRKRQKTSKTSYDETIHSIANLVAYARQDTRFEGAIGVGIPGSLRRSNQIIQGASLTYLNNRDLRADLETALSTDIRIENDANCFALSEAVDGAAAGCDLVFGIILGTGCGSGLVIHGRPVTGINGIAGEIGHNPLPWPITDEYLGHECWCGNDGCIETFISGTAVSKDYFDRTGVNIPVEEIAARVHMDLVAESVFQVLEDRLARTLAMIINTIDPDAIVLGGGLSNLERLYKNVHPKWPRLVFSKDIDTLLLKPKHGDSSGVRGAAWLWPDD
ncbi:MAG: ROK family protein [Candidatus Puniceispirillales bacterium]